jgi:hypothetical protein
MYWMLASSYIPAIANSSPLPVNFLGELQAPKVNKSSIAARLRPCLKPANGKIKLDIA